MTRTTWSAIGLGMVGMLLVGTAARAEEASKSGHSSSNSGLAYPDVVYLRGTIEHMDAPKHELTLDNGKTMQVNPDAKVMMNGKPGKMSDVKEGEEIRAGVSGKGDDQRIVEIIIMQHAATSTGAGSMK